MENDVRSIESQKGQEGLPDNGTDTHTLGVRGSLSWIVT